MCSTCGCQNDEKYTLNKIGDEANHSHEHHHHHEHEHSHPHGHIHHHHHDSMSLEQDVLQKNNLLAERNRGFFEAKNIFALNLVSSPGSGKTSILEKTIKELKGKANMYVIEGDQQTQNDADRVYNAGAPVIQVNTGNGCHLDSEMVNHAAKELDVQDNSILFIENVGNLVCPSLFDLGESKRVVIFSITEGEDKPLKYPNMFLSSDVCLLNKMDLLPHLNFDLQKAKDNCMRVNHHLQMMELSVQSGKGFEEWTSWLVSNISKKS